MKKLPLLLIMAASVMAAGCKKGLSDYGCEWIFEIENMTGSQMTFITDESEIVIAPQETKQIYKTKGMTADNKGNLYDLTYHPDEPLAGPEWSLMVGDKFLPEAVWIRRNWYFSTQPLYATYKLIVTYQLVEELTN